MQTSQSQKHLNHFGQRHFLPAGGALLLLLESLGQAEAAEEVAALGPLHLWQVLQGVDADRTRCRDLVVALVLPSSSAPACLCSRAFKLEVKEEESQQSWFG